MPCRTRRNELSATLHGAVYPPRGALHQASPELRQQYLKTLELLRANPFHPSLRLHPLKGRMAGLYSVSINLSYRITLELLIEDEQITPVNVGDHDTVY